MISTTSIKVCIALSACTLLALFHMKYVENKVNAAVKQVHEQYEKVSNKTVILSQSKTIELKDKQQDVDTRKEIAISKTNTKNKELLDWVRSNSNLNANRVQHKATSTSSTSSTRITEDEQSSNRTYFGRLSVKDAENLAEYARDAETLKIELLSCYEKYDGTKQTIDQYISELSIIK